MKIINSIVYEGRNIYSHKKCIQLEVDLEGYAEIPSKDIDNFNDSLVELLPILYTHRCGIDEDGGFVKRLKEGTYLAHICEHMIIAMQNMLGIDLGYGKAREISGEIYKIVYQYLNDSLNMRKVLSFVAVVFAAISVTSCGKLLDVFKDLSDELEDVLENYEERLSLSDDEMDKHIDQYDRIGDELERNLELSKLINGENDYETQLKYYDAIKINNREQVQALKDKDTLSLIKVKGCGMDTADRWIRKFDKNRH